MSEGKPPSHDDPEMQPDGGRTEAGDDPILEIVMHEIRSRLNLVSLKAARIARTDPRMRPAVSEVLRAVDQADALVGHIPEAARVTVTALRPVSMSVTEWLKEPLAAISRLGVVYGTEVDFESRVGPATRILCEPDRLQYALELLVKDAIGAVPPPSSVRVHCQEVDSELVVEVWSSLSSSRRRPASEEHLSELAWRLALRIVESHGGRMWRIDAPDGDSVALCMAVPLCSDRL